MTLESDIPGFGETNVRSDRLQVIRQPAGDGQQAAWVIVPHENDRPALTTCPCCGKPFETSKAAKLIANAVYPLAL